MIFLASFLYNTRIPTDVLNDHLLIVLCIDLRNIIFLWYYAIERGGLFLEEGRGQNCAQNFFCLPSKISPPPEGEQGDKFMQSLPQKSMKIHHFAHSAKNFMHSSLIFKGEGQNSEGGNSKVQGEGQGVEFSRSDLPFLRYLC